MKTLAIILIAVTVISCKKFNSNNPYNLPTDPHSLNMPAPGEKIYTVTFTGYSRNLPYVFNATDINHIGIAHFNDKVNPNGYLNQFWDTIHTNTFTMTLQIYQFQMMDQGAGIRSLSASYWTDSLHFISKCNNEIIADSCSIALHSTYFCTDGVGNSLNGFIH